MHDEQRVIQIYELSQTPQWPAVIELLNLIEKAHHKDLPKAEGDETAWRTSNYVHSVIGEVLDSIDQDIASGARLIHQSEDRPNDSTSKSESRHRA